MADQILYQRGRGGGYKPPRYDFCASCGGYRPVTQLIPQGDTQNLVCPDGCWDWDEPDGPPLPSADQSVWSNF